MSSQSHSTLHKTSTCELSRWWEEGSCSCLNAVKGGVNLMMWRRRRERWKLNTVNVKCFWLICNAQFFCLISMELRVECEGQQIYDYCDRAQLKLHRSALHGLIFICTDHFAQRSIYSFLTFCDLPSHRFLFASMKLTKTHIFSWISWWV